MQKDKHNRYLSDEELDAIIELTWFDGDAVAAIALSLVVAKRWHMILRGGLQAAPLTAWSEFSSSLSEMTMVSSALRFKFCVGRG
jgi:hypothetical protein